MARSATATFLFTDIEDSTRLWEEGERAMSGALARHDELLRAAVEEAGGEIVKTTGDGVHAAFDRPEVAIKVAADAQRALETEAWGDSGPLRVRIGIHSGVAEARGGDYYGTTVNRAARLMALAHPGQVLVSEATAVLARDALASDMELHDLGVHRLRGLTRPERVFQLVAPGLRAEFPDLHSLDATRSNLPVQVTSFVGRGKECTALVALEREHRLVTIIGVGGVGKTRLALEVAAELMTELRDGAWSCELAPATDTDAMVDVVASALGVVDRPGVARRESVLDFLSTRQMLLVLDNCEHLLDPVAQLAADVLQRCQGVRVLATSREPLTIPGEHVWSLRSLPLPSDGELDTLGANDAVRLFVERAEASSSGFALDESNGGAIAEICRRLDGMPLAIELAAARVLTMQPGEIASRLDERFRLLSGGRRASVERHQTLQATVDWSYSLLTDIERLVFGRLSVFPASFDADAARAVAEGDGLDSLDVLDALGSLAVKSMLTAEHIGDGTTRYGMLETLRQYGRDRLGELGAEEVDDRQRRHATHFAELAQELGRQLMTPDEIAAIQRVKVEIENFRSAISWALARGDGDDAALAVRISAGLALTVSMVRVVGFGVYAERCAPAAFAGPAELRFAALGGAAFSAWQRNDLELAKTFIDGAFAAGPSADESQLTVTYCARGLITIGTDLPETVRVMREGVEFAQERGDELSASLTRTNVAAFVTLLGDADAGRAEAEEALSVARRLRHPSATAVAAFVWALASWIDDPPAARAALEESIALTEAGAGDVISADARELLGRLEGHEGNVENALRLFTSAMRSSLAAGNRMSLAGHLSYAAEVLGTARIEPEVVGVLEGAAAHSSELTMVTVEGRERELHEVAINNARSAVGNERYDACAARGAAMTFEEIVDYVLTELDRIIEDLSTD